MSFKLMSAVIPVNFPSENHREDSEKLLNQLLECVQDCQKRFGGKTELATEFDNCVAALCLTLEAVFLHGLRNKPQENQQYSTLKQVSDIVTSSLHLGNDNPSFWPFVKKHLTKHEQERYAVLKHVWTDTGRCRAWLRSALNERSLERYFHTVLSDAELLNTHYEEWALLCDEEKNSMLPNMAAGLNSILFAVSIDRPELNSLNPKQRLNKLKGPTEPIIEAPIPEPVDIPKEKRKKKKVAKQFISFDDDDSVLSSSIPSSSSSITSENTQENMSSNKPKVTTEKLSSNESREKKPGEKEKDTSKTELKQRLSPLQSKQAEKESPKTEPKRRFSSLDGPLTPVTAENIGELTPVSVETNKSPDRLGNSSDDALEVSTDIVAVMDVVESRSKEEIEALQQTVDDLLKENENLRERVEKFQSATVEENLRDADGNVPDYKSEAKFFESKLLQVAEMHAELMDFNVVLQQTLVQKNSQIDKLQSELEELRGPLPPPEVPSDPRGYVNVWIPSAFLTGSGSDSHHVYQIFLRAGNDEWNIYRRYAQFHALHTDLKKLDPAVSAFDFPPKKSIGKKDSALVEERRKRLQLYLRRVLSHWPELAHCNSRFLLEQHLAFFKDQKENDQKNKRNSTGLFNSKRPARSTTSDNHYTGL